MAGGMVSKGGGAGNASRQSREVWEICEQSGRSLKRLGGWQELKTGTDVLKGVCGLKDEELA